MSKEKEAPVEKNVEKKPYTTPKLTVHGDVEEITQGSLVGEDLDAGFTTNSATGPGGRRPKAKRYS